MKEYIVCWAINLDAESPREAAEKALRIQRDPASIATVFVVYGEQGNEITVDLSDEP